jgi:hypothetical protein
MYDCDCDLPTKPLEVYYAEFIPPLEWIPTAKVVITPFFTEIDEWSYFIVDYTHQITLKYIEYDNANGWERNFFIRTYFLNYWNPWAPYLGWKSSTVKILNYPCHVEFSTDSGATWTV